MLLNVISKISNHFILQATCAADGYMRIYEALEVNNLAQWTLMDEISITANAGKESDGHYCLSWCPSRSTTPMIVVGCGKENCAKVGIISS